MAEHLARIIGTEEDRWSAALRLSSFPFCNGGSLSFLHFLFFLRFLLHFMLFLPVLLCLFHSSSPSFILILCSTVAAAFHLFNCFRVNCPFYWKIGACRHGDQCSRSHYKPTSSQTLVLRHMYRNPPVALAIAEGQTMITIAALLLLHSISPLDIWEGCCPFEVVLTTIGNCRKYKTRLNAINLRCVQIR